VRLLPDVATEKVAAFAVAANKTTSRATAIWLANRWVERESFISMHLGLLKHA